MSVESGSNVRGDIESLKQYLTNYNTQVGELDSNKWEGSSHDAFVKEAQAFYTECNKISTGMEAFAKACDEYNNTLLYEKNKKADREKQLATARSNNVNGCNDGLIETYKNEISECETKITASKEKIRTYLAEAASSKIEGASSYANNIGTLGIALTASSFANGNYMLLGCDFDKVLGKFGSQMDDNGIYPRDASGCDDYARAYCIYAQTGIAPSKSSVGVSDSKSGLTSKQISAGSRKEQAEIAYDLLVNQGKPSVIHINSSASGSGQGHWVTVVGVKNGVTKSTVKVDDLIILDPATGTMRAMSEDKEYCRTDTARCRYEPGYHINYYA